MTRDDDLRSQNIYSSVGKVYKQVLAEANGITPQEYLSSPKHQGLREKWIAVGFATVVEQLTGEKWYLNFPAKGQDPPDFSAAQLRRVDGKHNVAHVEITEADPFSLKKGQLTPEEMVVARIASKSDAATKGKWPPDWQLCVYCNFTGQLSAKPIREELEKIKPPFGQVWLLGANKASLSSVFIWEVWPGEQYKSIELSD